MTPTSDLALAAALTTTTTMPSPIGPLTLRARDGILTGVHMEDQRHMPRPSPDWVRDDAVFADAVEQLREYFAGDRTTFDLDLRFEGTPFQVQVWKQLQRIPFGETISYGELARRVGNPNASRAVGLANGRNPFAVVVPCHRVIGAGGRLTGYGGGLDRKAWLLGHESRRPSSSPSAPA